MLASGIALAFRAVTAPLVFASRCYGARHLTVSDEVPLPEFSLTLAAKIALDEVFFASEFALAAMISLRDRHRLAAEVSSAVQLYEARGWLAEPTQYHCTPPPLREPDLRRSQARGVSFEHLRFESGYEPHADEPGRQRWLSYTPNRTAHAWVLRHPGRPRPWLVCVPGYRMGQPSVDFTGFPVQWLHQHLGVNLVIPVFPFHGPRTVGRRGGDGFLTGDFLDTVHMEAQALWDTRRILNWVRSQGATAVGAYGVSLGGLTVALLAALEEDLHCVIAGVPAVCLFRLAQSHAPAAILELARFVGLYWSDVDLLLRVVAPLAVRPQVSRDRLYLFGGLADRLVLPDHVRDLWRHWDRPRMLWYEGGHVSFLWEKQVRDLLYEALVRSNLIIPFHRREQLAAVSA